MPIRFRRTFKIFPGVKINVSKGGISVSVGTKGATLNFSKRGVKQTLGIPGSGLSESSYLIKNDDDDDEKDKDVDKDARERKRDIDDDDGVGCFPWGCLAFVVILAVGGYVVADTYHLIPPNYLSHLLEQTTQWMKNAGL